MGGRRPWVLEDERAWLLGRIREEPEITMRELAGELAERGIMVSHVSVWNILRRERSVAPLHAFTSPTPGSGKSYMVDVVSSIYSGKPCPVIGKGESNVELEKRLHTSLVAGHPVVNIDNVNGELGGDFLCQAIERPEIDIRILGETRHERVQNNVTLFATGNNIRLTGDVTRRSMLCRLDAKLERPEQRTFSANPVNKVLANRGDYIAAALTIARAYRCAGSPWAGSTVPIGSFQGWSEFVRSP